MAVWHVVAGKEIVQKIVLKAFVYLQSTFLFYYFLIYGQEPWGKGVNDFVGVNSCNLYSFIAWDKKTVIHEHRISYCGWKFGHLSRHVDVLDTTNLIPGLFLNKQRGVKTRKRAICLLGHPLRGYILTWLHALRNYLMQHFLVMKKLDLCSFVFNFCEAWIFPLTA